MKNKDNHFFPRIGLVALSSALLLGACVEGVPDGESLDDEQPGLEQEGAGPPGSIDVLACPPTPACDPTIDVDLRPSLLLTRADLAGASVLDTHFQLEDVLQKLIDEASVKQTPTNLLRRLWDTQNTDAGGAFSENFQPHCDDSGSTINGFSVDCPRAEGALASAVPTDFEPVAVFNRFDLAANDGSHCGEYRIIYAMKRGIGSPMAGRNFIIFEGQLPNPNPSCGTESCRPVAEFWSKLSQSNPAKLGSALEHFYFDGLAKFGPVITPQNYGLGSQGGVYGQSGGQIRTNQFGNSFRWQLREFQLARGCAPLSIKAEADSLSSDSIKPPIKMACRLIARPVTVKDNPFGELFNDNPLDLLTAAFQSDFVNNSSGPSTVEKLAANTLMGIGLGTNDRYNAGQSTSSHLNSSDPDRYPQELNAGVAFAGNIQAELTNIGATALTPAHVAQRAMTQSCAGCHQHSNNADLGDGLTWPSSRGFVHVDELGRVSSALTDVFLPHREQVLETYLQACTPTIGGVGSKAAPSSGSATQATLGGSGTH